jgi:hypothetical protein
MLLTIGIGFVYPILPLWTSYRGSQFQFTQTGTDPGWLADMGMVLSRVPDSRLVECLEIRQNKPGFSTLLELVGLNKLGTNSAFSRLIDCP